MQRALLEPFCQVNGIGSARLFVHVKGVTLLYLSTILIVNTNNCHLMKFDKASLGLAYLFVSVVYIPCATTERKYASSVPVSQLDSNYLVTRKLATNTSRRRQELASWRDLT